MIALKNLVTGDVHYNLEEAIRYYDLYSGLIDLENYDINSIDLDDLCTILNHNDLYGCGSSFELVEVY